MSSRAETQLADTLSRLEHTYRRQPLANLANSAVWNPQIVVCLVANVEAGCVVATKTNALGPFNFGRTVLVFDVDSVLVRVVDESSRVQSTVDLGDCSLCESTFNLIQGVNADIGRCDGTAAGLEGLLVSTSLTTYRNYRVQFCSPQPRSMLRQGRRGFRQNACFW